MITVYFSKCALGAFLFYHPLRIAASGAHVHSGMGMNILHLSWLVYFATQIAVIISVGQKTIREVSDEFRIPIHLYTSWQCMSVLCLSFAQGMLTSILVHKKMQSTINEKIYQMVI